MFTTVNGENRYFHSIDHDLMNDIGSYLLFVDRLRDRKFWKSRIISEYTMAFKWPQRYNKEEKGPGFVVDIHSCPTDQSNVIEIVRSGGPEQ